MKTNRTHPLVQLCIVIILLAVPSDASAALNAGVVNGVWFSTPTPQDGEEVRIFSAVHNTSDETVSGTVAFLVNGEIAGTANFTVKSNDIISVSVPYIFNDGDHEVSAYITESDEEAVVHAIAPGTSVSVQPRSENPRIEDENTVGDIASETLTVAGDIVESATDGVQENVTPRIEEAAQSIENFRDSFLDTEPIETVSSQAQTDTFIPTETVSKTAGSFKDLVHSTQHILDIEDLAIWKKIVGVLLSLLALIVRLWFVWIIIAFGIIFYRLVRGSRIR